MMDCRNIGPELIDYIKDELDDDVRLVVEEHLESCDECRKELAELKQTFVALRSELVPIELSAHFRMALTERLDEATHIANHAKESGLNVIRSSERHFRDMNKPLVTRFVDHAKRSPYFVASLLVHAAALVIILTLVVQNNKPNTVVHTDGTYTARLVPAHPSPRQTAYLTRSEVRNIETRATRSENSVDVRLDNLYFVEDGNVVLVEDKQLGCVNAFYAGRDGNATAEEFHKAYPDSLDAKIINAKISIPKRVASTLSASLDLIVFSMRDRLEFWSKPNWRALEAEYRSSAMNDNEYHIRFVHPASAVLPRRRELFDMIERPNPV